MITCGSAESGTCHACGAWNESGSRLAGEPERESKRGTGGKGHIYVGPPSVPRLHRRLVRLRLDDDRGAVGGWVECGTRARDRHAKRAQIHGTHHTGAGLAACREPRRRREEEPHQIYYSVVRIYKMLNGVCPVRTVRGDNEIILN